MLKKILLFIFCIQIFPSNAQLIDYVQVYAGTRIFPLDQDLDPFTGLPNKFYAGYAPGQILGASAYRQITDHLCLGGNFEIGNTRKPNYNLNIATIGANAKYNFNNIESFISPYATGGLTYSFVSVSQSEHIDGPIDLTSNRTEREPGKFYPDFVTHRYTTTNILFIPIYGFQAGAGLEFKIREGWGLYAEYRFSYAFIKNAPTLQKEYYYNKSNLIYHNIVFGLRLFL